MRCLAASSVVAIVFTLAAAKGALAQDDQPGAIQIDANYPGGNILVQKMEGDTVDIAQDLGDTSTWWFYYNFRVRGANGRELTFRWTNRSPMAALGPAVSTDGGRSWEWLGNDAVQRSSFVYRFPNDAEEVRFCLAMPYQLADLERFIDQRRDHPSFERTLHATTPKGRKVYRLHVGKLDGEPKHRVVFTCRHHACEMMASYTLEGVIDAMLANTDDGRWFRQNVEVLAVPIMDVDGVEDGDQGKNRKPHDHNRDYEGAPLYPSVAANKQFIPKWSEGKPRVLLDLHCPWVRGGGESRGSNEQIYFVGGPDQEIWRNATKLAIMFESVQAGSLPYKVKHNLPHGESWNTTAANLNRSFSRWGAGLPGVMVSNTIEIPYAVAGGEPVTPQSARALGRDLARALRRYLTELEE